MEIAHIALPVPLARLFDYQIPVDLKNKIVKGGRVKVSFGPRQAVGIIVAISNASLVDHASLKPIDEVIDETSLFPNNLWRLLNWASQYYHYPIGEVLFHALPALLRQGKPVALMEATQWQLTDEGMAFDLSSLNRAPKQKQLLKLLQDKVPDATLQSLGFNPSFYRKLADKALIKRVAKPTLDETGSTRRSGNPSHLALNQEQLSAIKRISEALSRYQVWLLEGVTGSGKTEIYLSTIVKIVASGLQALVLVPEISLTPQTIDRFRARFNAPIDVLHSGLSDKQRLAVYFRAKVGLSAIVIGTRSALFTPFKDLGLIVIDEEHDGAYKQQEGFRYHARDLAVARAKLETIPIILGSATPSLESLYNVKQGKYQRLKLTKRAGHALFSHQQLIDIKGLALNGGLSKPLIHKIGDHLTKQQQVLLFLNRRGYAPLLICHECGWIATCHRCDKPYTYHQHPKKLSCHHCDSTRSLFEQCKPCGSTRLKTLNVGTEQLEEQLKVHFPLIPISRIDKDSTTKKGMLENYLAEINQGKAHILVGTQILAKGHHFPNVTLVGIIDVDSALFSTDFRAAERFAQIYTQVAGRAGRENKRGEVVIQTYHPTHPLLNLLLSQNYSAFASKALQERSATLLPPYTYHVLIRAADKNNRSAPIFLDRAYQWINTHYQTPHLWVLKPNPAILAKKAGYYRWQLLLQHTDRLCLHQLTKELHQQILTWRETKSVRWNIDVDPVEA